MRKRLFFSIGMACIATVNAANQDEFENLLKKLRVSIDESKVRRDAKKITNEELLLLKLDRKNKKEEERKKMYLTMNDKMNKNIDDRLLNYVPKADLENYARRDALAGYAPQVNLQRAIDKIQDEMNKIMKSTDVIFDKTKGYIDDKILKELATKEDLKTYATINNVMDATDLLNQKIQDLRRIVEDEKNPMEDSSSDQSAPDDRDDGGNGGGNRPGDQSFFGGQNFQQDSFQGMGPSSRNNFKNDQRGMGGQQDQEIQESPTQNQWNNRLRQNFQQDSFQGMGPSSRNNFKNDQRGMEGQQDQEIQESPTQNQWNNRLNQNKYSQLFQNPKDSVDEKGSDFSFGEEKNPQNKQLNPVYDSNVFLQKSSLSSADEFSDKPLERSSGKFMSKNLLKEFNEQEYQKDSEQFQQEFSPQKESPIQKKSEGPKKIEQKSPLNQSDSKEDVKKIETRKREKVDYKKMGEGQSPKFKAPAKKKPSKKIKAPLSEVSEDSEAQKLSKINTRSDGKSQEGKYRKMIGESPSEVSSEISQEKSSSMIQPKEADGKRVRNVNNYKKLKRKND